MTSEIRRRKKKENTTVKYKPFGIAMPCGLIRHNWRSAKEKEIRDTLGSRYYTTWTGLKEECLLIFSVMVEVI